MSNKTRLIEFVKSNHRDTTRTIKDVENGNTNRRTKQIFLEEKY